MERFWNKIHKKEPTECWLWNSCIHKEGYGQFYYKGKVEKAHRISYILTYGEIPEGLLIRHTCDVRHCVNPNHLLTGTDMDNTNDKIERNRHNKGIDHARCKLTEEQVIQIRYRYENEKVSHSVLAKEYDVKRACIASILSRRTWKHI
jgi:hypothetical protein